MTTATTVLGLFLWLWVWVKSKFEPMAIAVISGLLTSTFLTLLIIPTIYYLFALAQERWFVAADDPSES